MKKTIIFMTNYSDLNNWMTTSRIETLVDGIFAIAMTLLVLSIGVPDVSSALTEAAFQQQLGDLLPKILMYALSFWILAGFWRVNHQQFFFIKRSNATMITINVCWLLFIALVPFSTEIIGEFGSYFTASVIFQLNLFFAGVLYCVNWIYAVRKGLIDENLDEASQRMVTRTSMILPFLSLIALALSYYVFAWANLVYMAHPIIKKLIQ
ncbi:MAG: TMEM175 family protein [Methanobacterium sp.]|nr:TMEM175 family protein [Methanobacterium sp.]